MQQHGDGAETGQEHSAAARANAGGCLLVMFISGAVAVAGSIWLFNGWDTLGGGGKAGAVLLCVAGAMFLLPPLLMLGIKIAVRILLRRVAGQFNRAAAEMIEQNRAMYGRVHAFREASETDFSDLDRAFYDQTQAELTARGYRHLGDVIDRTIEDAGSPCPVIRVMNSPDGAIIAGFYHFTMADLRAVDFESEFSDGTFLTTANTLETDLTTPPPRLVRRQFPRETPVAELLAAHEAECQKLLAARSDVSAVPINTLDDCIAMQQRLQAVKNEFRQSIGYVDPEEVRRIGHDMIDAEAVDGVANAVDELRDRESPRHE